jgi:hypothetical protein
MPAEHGSCPACGSKWRLPLLLAIVLVAILLTQIASIRNAIFKPATPLPVVPDDRPAVQQVLLTINYGDGRPLQNETALWRDGMTVGDLLQGEPRVNLAVEGSGASAFLTQLGGVANEGSGGRNWLYSVNGKRADRSMAVYELAPNDHVLWTFARGE